MAGLRGELTHHEVFCEVFFQPWEAADGSQRTSPRDDCRSHGELHALQHSCHQNPTPEIRIQTRGLETSPDAFTGHGSIRTRGNPNPSILELGGHDAQQVRGHPNVAITHHDQVIRGDT